MLKEMRPSYRHTMKILPRSISMASHSSSNEKKLIQIDIVADIICPSCFVGKRHLDKAIASSGDRYNFEIKWHPYLILPSARKEAINKKEFFRQLPQPRAFEKHEAKMTKFFMGFGLDYDMSGLVFAGRLMCFARQQGLDKQHKLVEELFIGHLTQGKNIDGMNFLVESAEKSGVEGAAEFLEDPNNGLDEVNKAMKAAAHAFSWDLPNFALRRRTQYGLSGGYGLSGCWPPEEFLRCFQIAGGEKEFYEA